MSESVVPAYKEAYSILQNDVLNLLLTNVSTDNETAINQLVSNLTCAIQSVYDALDTAVNDSQTLRVEIDQKLVNAATAVSAKENEISRKQGEIQQKNTEIQGVQSQLATAEQGLRDKQQGLANAENDLRIAQQKVFDVLVEKPLCSVVNPGGIDRGKDARHNAEQQVQSAQQQVDSVRQQLSSLQGQKSSLDTQLSQLQTQLQELQSALITLREVSNSTATINYELKKIIGHITKIWDASSVKYTMNLLSIRANQTTNVSSLFQQETDEQVLSQTDIDYPWQQLISAGPVAINVLGQLIVLSTKIDFSLKESVGDYKFKYIRNPQSYRGTLIQIANDGWEAFNQAHSSMNTIQLYMAQIPGHVKTSFQILMQASPRLIKNLLVPSLNSIDGIGKECSRLASNTHDSFVNVMQLLGEVIEITVVTQGVHMQRVKEVEIELNVSRTAEQYQEQIIHTVQKHYDEAQEAVRTAQAAYAQALKDLPTGWDKILQNFVQAVTDVIDDVAPVIVGALVGGPVGAGVGAGVAATRGGSGGGGNGSIGISDIAAGLGDKIILSQSLSVAKMLSDQLNALLNSVTENVNASAQMLTKDFASYRVAFNAMNNLLKTVKGDSELTKTVGNILQSAIDVTNLKDADKIISQLTSLIEQLKPLVAAKSIDSTKIDAQDTAQRPQSSSNSNSGNYDNEKFKVTITLDRLQKAIQRSDDIFQQWLEQQDKMKELMVKIARLDLTKINYEQIIELLRQGILLLGNIRVQWGRLVRFFSEISIRTRFAVNETLVPFVDRMKEVSSLSDITQSERTFYIGLLKGQTVNIHRQSYILYAMSRTYVDISNEFMMDKLSGLAMMLGMQTDQERNEAVQKLLNDTEKAQTKVQALADKRKKTFEETVLKRQNELETYLDHLGGKTQDDLDAIKEGDELLTLS
ncbi:unnamed protein product [Didymodactylos carnosus]|uniref:Uncharacterized protein n=1 Tax=Didymodactylos carnosus TaxID=1234261 RepID=A0A815NU51_9BILA|nr:unnamed protein product [Didymodactylos carnosus]CAF1434234.1 unnamed protein product [Didymodactylos carnosus]CAF4101180.1 unnamed protein product [Didymodactylos carnosus]CAF4312124.1 unnamed protein product [Didymodactylos carnosus]